MSDRPRLRSTPGSRRRRWPTDRFASASPRRTFAAGRQQAGCSALHRGVADEACCESEVKALAAPHCRDDAEFQRRLRSQREHQPPRGRSARVTAMSASNSATDHGAELERDHRLGWHRHQTSSERHPERRTECRDRAAGGRPVARERPQDLVDEEGIARSRVGIRDTRSSLTSAPTPPRAGSRCRLREAVELDSRRATREVGERSDEIRSDVGFPVAQRRDDQQRTSPIGLRGTSRAGATDRSAAWRSSITTAKAARCSY